MGVYKNFKTFVRKKIGMVGVAEFVDDAVQSNSKESWNSWFANPKFLHEYAEPRRLASFRQFVSLMEKHIDMNSATSAIDVGCGTGHLLMAIFEKYPAIKLTGTDFSEQAIAVAKQTMAQPEQSIQKTGRCGVTLYVSDIYNSSIPENKFDLVICSEVLEHLLHPERALLTIKQLCANDGNIVLSTPNGRVDNYTGHINFWSPESWEVFLHNNFDENRYDISTALFNNNRNNFAVVKCK